MYLPWLFYLFLILGLFVISRIIVKYYIDPAECYSFAVISISVSLSVSMICILIVPIDAFVTSHPNELFHTLRILINKYFIKQLFVYLYSFLLLITFILLPFNYFYSSQLSFNDEDDFDLDFQSQQAFPKVKKAIISTCFFVFIIFSLLLLGLFFRPDREFEYQRGKEIQWIKSLFDVDHVGEQALGFCISIIVCIGSFFWFIYGSFGLTSLPFQLIKGYKSLNDERFEIDNDMAKLRDRYRSIQDKYQKNHYKITKNDQKTLVNLKKRERLLNLKTEKLSILEKNQKTIQTILNFFSPIRTFIGIVFLLISMLIYVSFAITIYERVNYSQCGMKCGYLIEQRIMLNPIDRLFVYSSYYFPLDYLIFFMITIFIFICTLYGVITLGVNFLCIKVCNRQQRQFHQSLQIKKQSTHPQVLFILAFIQNISILVVCSQLMTLCPQYSTFGNQVFYDIKSRSYDLCTLEAVSKVEAKFICSMTNLSTFYNKVSMGFPLFGVIFFLSNCSFIILYSICFLVFLFKPKISQLQVIIEQVKQKQNVEEDELDFDEEKRSLLSMQ